MNPVLHTLLFYAWAVVLTIAVITFPMAARDTADTSKSFFGTWFFYAFIGCLCIVVTALVLAIPCLICWLIAHA